MYLGFKFDQSYPIGKYQNLIIKSTRRNFEWGSITMRKFGFTRAYRAFLKFENQEERASLGESSNLEKIKRKSIEIKQRFGIA